MQQDRSHLQEPQIQASYSCIIVNRFSAISEENADDWQHFKESITGAVIFNATIQIMNQHCEGQLQGNVESIDKSTTFAIRVSEKTTKILGWRGKESGAAQHNNLGEVSQLLWQTKAGLRSRNYLTKILNGAAGLPTEAECLDYWTEHFQQLLNCLSPEGIDGLPNKHVSNDYMDTYIQTVTEAEVAADLKHLIMTTALMSVPSQLSF